MPDLGNIRIMCPNLSCQRVLSVPEHARGKLVRCRGCSMTVRIPASKTAPTPQQPQPIEQGKPEGDATS